MVIPGVQFVHTERRRDTDRVWPTKEVKKTSSASADAQEKESPDIRIEAVVNVHGIGRRLAGDAILLEHALVKRVGISRSEMQDLRLRGRVTELDGREVRGSPVNDRSIMKPKVHGEEATREGDRIKVGWRSVIPKGSARIKNSVAALNAGMHGNQIRAVLGSAESTTNIVVS